MRFSRLRAVAGVLGLLIFAASLAVALPGSSVAATPTNFSVTMVGDPGDYIAGNLSRLWRTGAGSIGIQRNPSARDELMVNVSGGPSNSQFSLLFAAPHGQSLRVGNYTDAERATSRSGTHPGIDIFGEGHGCNETSGSFRVLDYAADLSRLWIVYEQHCEGATPAVFGEIRYHEPRDSEFAPMSSRVDWPTEWVHRRATTIPVSWLNTGTRPVTVSGAEISDGDADFSPVASDCTVVAPGETCTVSVAFHPALPGPRSGELQLHDSTTSGTHTVELFGSGAPGRTGWDLTSDSDDPVSSGAPHTFTPVDDDLTFYGTSQRLDFAVNPDAAWSTGRRWGATFAAPQGQALSAGMTYTHVAAYTSPPRDDTTGPTMKVVGNSAVCSTVTGTFTLDSVHYDERGVASEASVSFEQHCNGAAGALRGTIVWRAPTNDVSAPSPVTALHAHVVAGTVALDWTNPSEGDWADTVVRRAPGSNAPATNVMGTPTYHGLRRTASVRRVTLGVAHSFSVFSTDDNGNTSPPVSVTIPGSAMTSTSVPAALSYGARTTISGQLTDPTTHLPLAGEIVHLYCKPHARTSWSLVATRTSDATGRYSTTQAPTANTDYQAQYAGSDSRLPGISAVRTVAVSPRLSLAVSHLKVKRHEPVTFSVGVSPNLAGQRVSLQRHTSRGWAVVATKSMSSSSHATFVIKPVKGTSSYRIFKPTSPTHAAALSRSLIIKVT